jgi:nitrogen-specific signal transduction histidine kinase
MIAGSPFLAVPIKARIVPDGTFQSADPPIWRLHFLAGGQADGAVAIPGLAELALHVLQTNMRMERAIRAADEEKDVELWAVADPFEGSVQVTITGWRDVALPDMFSRNVSASTDGARRQGDQDTLLIDPDLRIVRFPTKLSTGGDARVIGEHIGNIFNLERDQSGAIPLVNRLVERQAINDEVITLATGGAGAVINLSPQFAPDGRFLGHGGELHISSAEEDDLPLNPNTAALPMGKQFASVLKQPLSRIFANAETIGSRLHGDLQDNYAEYAQDIANAARHLSELVSDMEDLEAIDRPDFHTARDRIELGDIARRVTGLLALKAADHGICFIVPGEGEKVEAIGEFRRILQILLNLSNNAIRYAPDGSIVTISLEKRGQSVAISVADQGTGIAAENRSKVFEKFERLGRSGDGGSGLGLYISRRLARAMGGDLDVEDAPEGGALFRLTLPAR